MTEEQATYEGRFCGNCGLRVDGDCTLDLAEMEECLLTPGRSHWRKLATDRDKLNEFLKSGAAKYDPKSRYYNHGGIEVLDIIKAKLTPEQYQGFCLGNAIKYTCRANHKGDYDRDLEKAEFYTREAR